MTIKTFDRATVKSTRDELAAALAVVEANLGVKIDVGNARFTATNVTFKVELSVLNSTGNAQDKYRVALEAFYPGWADKTVNLNNGLSGKVVGWNKRASKYPFIVETANGKFKVNERTVEFGG